MTTQKEYVMKTQLRNNKKCYIVKNVGSLLLSSKHELNYVDIYFHAPCIMHESMT